MSPTPAKAASPDDAALYELTAEQVKFIRELMAAIPLSGTAEQLRLTLAMMDNIQAALASPVERKT